MTQITQLIFQLDFWLFLIGGILLVRQLCLILAAEQGRKYDLVKKLYQASLDFKISVLIPFLESSQLESLLNLIQSLENQEYPATKIAIHVVATERTVLDIKHQPLQRNVKIWTYPSVKTTTGDMLKWLIERCLATTGQGLLVFLKPTDIVKADFLQNVVARGFDNPVIQGYVAIKHRPESLLGRVLALADRLANRIDNAGRYHLGMSCQLMDTAWVVQQEVVEMIPYHRGWDLSHYEYTLRLNLQNFRVTWAPNVVVYTDEQTDFVQYVSDCIGSFFNRLKLMATYGWRLVIASVEEWDYRYFEQFLNMVKPPNFLLGMTLLALTLMTEYQGGLIPGKPFTWGMLTVGFYVTQILSLFVARCRGSDYITFFLFVPLVYVVGLLTLPIAALHYLSTLMARAGTSYDEPSYRRIIHNRFNEVLEPDPYPTLLDEDSQFEELPENRGSTAKPFVKSTEPPPQITSYMQKPQAPRLGEVLRKGAPREQVKTVSISNGSKEISCLLRLLTSDTTRGDEQYQLVLEYKSTSFSTAVYKILDQAFYELHAKLQSRGFTLMTCGTCGNFYNPSADIPGALKNSGVCLFGKLGKEVNLVTDGVTVLSPSCPYHCSIQERETILREWRDSISTSSPQVLL